MLANELRKRAAASSLLRKLAAQKTAGPVMRFGGRALASMAARPLVTATGGLGAATALHKGVATWHSMNPKAHATMLGMP